MKIAFAHNVYDRYNTLKKTIDIDRKYFKDSIVSVAYNYKPIDGAIKTMDINISEYFSQESHKIGCINGFIISIDNLKSFDFDVLIFSHDDVFINNIEVFNKNCLSIYNGEYDIICRSPAKNYGDNYYMMECIFINAQKIKSIISKTLIIDNEKKIPLDIRGSASPEVWLFNLLFNNKLNIKNIVFDNKSDDIYNNQLEIQMGVHHKNIGKRGWKD